MNESPEKLPLTESERLDYVIGQLASLTAFCFSLMETHPKPALLRKHFIQSHEITIAKTLASGASEKTLEGIEETMRVLSAALSTFEGPPKGPP